MDIKQCPHCKEWKSLDTSNFVKERFNKSGFSSWCKACSNAAEVERRKHKILPDFDPETLKCCTGCKQTKKVTEYFRSKDSVDGFNRECKECSYKRHEEYRKRPGVKEVIKEKSRLNWVKANYGLSPEEYRKLCEDQPFCPICLTSFSVTEIHVDHNHETGAVRGLLCEQCNHFIGLIKENTTSILNMLEYLEKYK